MVFKFFKREKAAESESGMDDTDMLEPLSEPAVFVNAADSAKDNEKDDDKLEIPVFLRRETEYKTEDYIARLEQFKRELREKRKA